MESNHLKEEIKDQISDACRELESTIEELLPTCNYRIKYSNTADKLEFSVLISFEQNLINNNNE